MTRPIGLGERIPIHDLLREYRAIRADAMMAFDATGESTLYMEGPEVERFEEEFASWSHVKHCVAVNSGTSAMHLALCCLDIGPGDEVITVPMSFVGVVSAIRYLGATPVFVDIDPERRTLDPMKLEAAITRRTKAIVPVHLYGQMADMEPIVAVARQRGIPVIEDAAHAPGALYNGRRAGSFGLLSCFSFSPGMNLGAVGDGGAIVTHNDALAVRLASLRNHALDSYYQHDEVGYDYRMPSLQAALLRLKLRNLDEWNAARAFRAQRYRELLANVDVGLPELFSDSQSVWHSFVIESEDRDLVREALSAANIESTIRYPIPAHLQRASAQLGYRRGDFPMSEHLAECCLALPLFPDLSEDQMDRVVTVIMSVVGARL